MQSSKSATLLDCIEAAKKTDDLSSSYLVTNVSKSAESTNIKYVFQSHIQYSHFPENELLLSLWSDHRLVLSIHIKRCHAFVKCSYSIAPFLTNLVSYLVSIDSSINILLVVWEVGWYHLFWKSNNVDCKVSIVR